MKKNSLTLLSLLLAAGLLASCGETPVVSSSSSAQPVVSSQQASSSAEGASSSAQSSSSQATTYKIVIRASEGVNIEANKERAEPGEKVTLRVSLAEGYSLTGIFLNGDASPLTKESEGVYSFTMPETSAVIATTVSISGDCVVSGDVAALLTQQSDGTYSGSFTCESEATILVEAAGKSYGYTSVDKDASFAYFDAPNLTGKAVSKIRLAGNAKYRLDFDPSAEKPIVITRTGVVHAPTSDSELASLFNGDFAGRGVLDGGAFHTNVTKVHYKNNLTFIDYNWNLYEDGSSYATAYDMVDEETYHVYKAVNDGLYTVVDDYIESEKDSEGNYYDDSEAKLDTYAYAGNYALDDSLDDDTHWKQFKRTSRAAKDEVEMPSHNMYSMSREIGEGYRWGFTVEDEITAANVSVTSTTGENGGFEVTVYAWKIDDETASTYSSGTSVTRVQYDTTISFNADTTIASASYLKTVYDESSWSFDVNDAANGGKAIAGTKGKTTRRASWSYEYGSKAEGSPDFDKTPYFVSSVSNVHATSKGLEEDHVQQKDVVDDRHLPSQVSEDDDYNYGYSTVLSYDYAPSTALDVWQYGVIASSDENVIGEQSRYGYGYRAIGKGTTVLTVGNHVGGAVTSVSGTITVQNDIAPSSYYVWVGPDCDSSVVPSSSQVELSAGEIVEIYLWASPSNCGTEPTVSTDNENVVATLMSGLVTPTGSTAWSIGSYPCYLLRIDASKMTNTAKTSCNLLVSDPSLSSPVSISITVDPLSGYVWPSTLAGTTWNGNQEITEKKASDMGYTTGVHCESSLRFTDEDFATLGSVSGAKKCHLSATYNGTTREFDIGYVYNPASTKKVSFYVGQSDYSLSYEIDRNNGYIGLTFSISSWSGADEADSDDVIGYPEEDDEAAVYEWFTIAA